MSVDARSEADRRTALRDYARVQLQMPNKAQALLNIVQYAVELSGHATSSSFERNDILVDDLMAVIVGDGFTVKDGRGRGPYYVGDNRSFWGSTGFQADMRDNWFQVHHAIAGLVIGYRYGIMGEAFARSLEDEPQDDRLYAAICSVGELLSGLHGQPHWSGPTGYEFELSLPTEELVAGIEQAICDNTCALPSGAADLSFGDSFPRLLFKDILKIVEQNRIEEVEYPDGSVDIDGDGKPDISVQIGAANGDNDTTGTDEQVSYPGDGDDTTGTDEQVSYPGDGDDTTGTDEQVSYPGDGDDTTGTDEQVSYPGDGDDTTGTDEQVSYPGDGDDTTGTDEQVSYPGDGDDTTGTDEQVSYPGDGDDTTGTDEQVSYPGDGDDTTGTDEQVSYPGDGDYDQAAPDPDGGAGDEG